MTEKFDLHISLTGAFRAEHRVWEVELGKIGISKGQPKMLGYLKHNDGCMQKDIAAGTGIEPPSATSILAVMERDGLVQRVQSEEDRRRYSVFLTPKGYEKAKQVEEISQKLSAELLANFSEEESRTLFALLERVEKNAAESLSGR